MCIFISFIHTTRLNIILITLNYCKVCQNSINLLKLLNDPTNSLPETIFLPKTLEH